MKESLFKSRWFTEFSTEALKSGVLDSPESSISNEGGLMSRLFLNLLDAQRQGTLFNEGLYHFYSFCQQRLHLSHSQILQDLWVLYMLKEKRDGFFVEFGACDGKSLSNTLLLEQKFGWKGILAEPNPLWHDELAKSRTATICHDCVAAQSDQTVTFLSTPDMPELSRMKDIVPDDIHERIGNRNNVESFDVNTISLNDLLIKFNAPHQIDYISIDTEGSELAILETFDFGKFDIRLFSIEHGGDTPRRNAVKKIMEANGYMRWRAELTRWDDWYVKQAL